MQRNEENDIMGKTTDLFKQGNISCKDGHNKGQKWHGTDDIKKRWQEYTELYKKKIYMTHITMMV